MNSWNSWPTDAKTGSAAADREKVEIRKHLSETEMSESIVNIAKRFVVPEPPNTEE